MISIPAIGAFLSEVAVPAFVAAVPQLIKMAKNVIDQIGQESAKEVSELKPVSSNSSVDDIKQTSEVLDTFRNQIKTESQKVQEAATNEIKDYLDELNILIQENDALMSKYHIKPRGIDRKLGKMLDAIGQDMDIAVSRSIAFNNPACREIIEMLPGTKKEEKAASFLQNTLCDALQTGCEDIKNILDDTFGDLNEEIPDAVEKVSAELKQANEELQKLSAEYSEENVKATTGNALQKISACDLVLGLLEVS